MPTSGPERPGAALPLAFATAACLIASACTNAPRPLPGTAAVRNHGSSAINSSATAADSTGANATASVPTAETPDQTAKRIFMEQCAACHNIGKMGKPSHSVPLDHVGRYRSVASIAKKIRHPEKENPYTSMPLFPKDRISESELRDLSVFLGRLK